MGVSHRLRGNLRKPPIIAITVLCIVVLYMLHDWVSRAAVPIKQRGVRHREPPNEDTCIPELSNLNLKDKIFLSRRCVTPVWSRTVNRDVVASIPDDPLIKTNTFVDLQKCDRQVIESIPCEPLELEVPLPFPEAEYPEFLFGVTTSHGRLLESMGPWMQWLAHSKAKIVAAVTDRVFADDDPERIALERLMSENGIDMTIVNGRGRGLDRAREHFLMMKSLTENIRPTTKWIGILDDDTFFPSLWPIREQLSKYDPAKRYYIGALSENFGAVIQWGFQAFGGAGVFLSVTLLKDLDPWLETCAQTSNTNQGDVLLRQCVDWYTRTKLTLMPGLYQMDLMEDINGFYEGGLNPLSLHHWKSWHHAPVADIARIGDVCGECLLQRWKFGDNTILANGFSVNVYGEGVLNNVNLDRLEGTWHNAEDPRGQWDFSVGPVRPKIDYKNRKRLLLVETEWLDEHTLRQVYVWNGTRPTEERRQQQAQKRSLKRRSLDLPEGHQNWEERQDDMLERSPYEPEEIPEEQREESGFGPPTYLHGHDEEDDVRMDDRMDLDEVSNSSESDQKVEKSGSVNTQMSGETARRATRHKFNKREEVSEDKFDGDRDFDEVLELFWRV